MANLGFGAVAAGAVGAGALAGPAGKLPPVADDAAIFELSYTSGNSGVYVLAGAWGGFFPFSSEYPDGARPLIRVTDGSANTEISRAVYNAVANTLAVIGAPLASTNAGALVNWSGRTRLLIHALNEELPICDTAPTVGQVLAWDGTEWCPATLGTPSAPIPSFPLCATPPTDGQILVWDAANNDWCPADLCALVRACMAFSPGAVSFGGDAFLYNLPAAVDSPVGTLSFWTFIESLPTGLVPISGGITETSGGDLFNYSKSAGLINLPTYFGPIGDAGSDPAWCAITGISSAAQAVIATSTAHRVTVGAWIVLTLQQSGWSGVGPLGPQEVVAVGANTITINYDSTGQPGYSSGANPGAAFVVLNSVLLQLMDAPFNNWYFSDNLTPIPAGRWVNVLMSWDMNHSAGNKIFNLFYDDVQITANHIEDASAAFSVFYSDTGTNSVSGVGPVGWNIGLNSLGTPASNECIVGFLSEFWYAPGQYIDFTVAGNRALFHDGSNKPISLGADGSLPLSGTKPLIYLTLPSSDMSPMNFLLNATGNGALTLNATATTFVIAPSHP